MRASRGEASGLQFLAIEPDGYEAGQRYPMVVLLHGFGAHMGDLASLCPAISREGYVYLCPNGPIPVDLGFGALGFAWSPPKETQGGSGDAAPAEQMLVGLLRHAMERHGVTPAEVVLGGFSQGGMMTYRCGLTAAEPFAGLAVLSGRVSDWEGLLPRLAPHRDQPIFVAHGTEDTMIPVENARTSLALLREQGYAPEYREYPMGHEIAQPMLDDLIAWLRVVLPPRGS